MKREVIIADWRRMICRECICEKKPSFKIFRIQRLFVFACLLLVEWPKWHEFEHDKALKRFSLASTDISAKQIKTIRFVCLFCFFVILLDDIRMRTQFSKNRKFLKKKKKTNFHTNFDTTYVKQVPDRNRARSRPLWSHTRASSCTRRETPFLENTDCHYRSIVIIQSIIILLDQMHRHQVVDFNNVCQ